MLICITEQVISQCNGQEFPAVAYTCDSAPVLCNIACLDGFGATMPSDSIGVQPISLCDGGVPNNMTWFAFVAGSDSINILISPSSCTTVVADNNSYSGIQVGIWDGCDFEGDSDEVICSTTASTSPLALASGDFQIGQTYYLFIDGYVGSVCDYTIDIQYGMEAFDMPEFTTVSNNFDIDFNTDTLCAGAEVEVSLDGFTLDVSYLWQIEPSTDIYSDGIHPVDDTSSVVWQFFEPGQFTISVVATNGCDVNDTLKFDVVVDTLQDEYFTDLMVCQNCLGSLVLPNSDTTCVIGNEGIVAPSILTENPNGDDIVGWLGYSNIIVWGLQENVVPAQYGCEYSQFVNVVPIPIGSREDVLMLICEDDFPFDYHGTMITGPVTNQMITLDNMAASRCDSLVSLTVESYGQSATIENGNCVDGGLEIAITINENLPSGTVVSHEWEYNSIPVEDNDNIDSTIVAKVSGFYTVITTLDFGGDTCSFSRSKLINLNNITPETPLFGSFPTEVCDNEPVIIYVNQAGSDMSYEWSLIPPLPFTEGSTSDTIYVDATGNLGFQYTVSGSNDCGMSLDTMQIMTVTSMPTVDINIQQTVCQDSIFTVKYEGNANLSETIFTWMFDDAEVVQTSDINGPGPHEVRFSNSGDKVISVTVSQGPCSSEQFDTTIEVLPPFIEPTVDCEPLVDGVSFIIQDLPASVMYTYQIISGNYTTESQNDNVITFGGMPLDETISISISYVTDCGIVESPASCTSLDCPQVNLEVMLNAPDGLCYDPELNISMVATIDGNITQSGTWNGMYVSADGVFDVKMAGIGENNAIYTITSMSGCSYSDTLVVEIFPTPTLTYEIIDENCDPVDGVSVKVLSDISTTAYLGLQESPDSLFLNVTAGQYVLSVVSEYNCTDSVVVNIEEQPINTLNIFGDSRLEANAEATYTYESNFIEDSIVWFINDQVVCENCSQLTYEPEDGDEVCLQVWDESGCDLSQCLIIETYTSTKVFFASAFSPNGDNNNDYFYPISNNPQLPVLQFMIFDRWGNCVYHKENATMGENMSGWDGTFNSNTVDPGVYIYTLQYLDELGNSKQISGDVAVIL